MTEVVAAQPGDLDTLGGLVARAFHDLPPARWLIGNETIRRRIFPRYFQILVEHAFAVGVVSTTSDRAAAALWVPVVTGPPAVPDGYPERLAAVAGPWTSRFVAFDAALDSRHPAGRPHHHLVVLAVRPDRQGHGIGTALLQAHHLRLDQDSMPGYLEASSQRSRQLYLRHGYSDHGRPIELADGPSLFPMWREPVPQHWAAAAGACDRAAGSLPVPASQHPRHPAGARWT